MVVDNFEIESEYYFLPANDNVNTYCTIVCNKKWAQPCDAVYCVHVSVVLYAECMHK